MPSKSLLERGFKSKAEKIAEEYRAELGISKFDALDAFALAEHLNVSVFTVDDAFDDKSSPHYISMSDTTKFSAMWMPNEDGDKIIIHNANHSKYRQQSNVMHELAHIIRGHKVPEAHAKLCAQYNLHYFNTLHEQEAKHLGGCLQITTPGLLWALKRFTEDQISEYYCASIEMVKYRIGVSGANRIRTYQNK